jgi:ABC-type glycerol-3-phosphate transport system permease component
MATNTLRRFIVRLALYFILIVSGLIYIFPFIWMVLSSFKFLEDVLAVPIRFFPPKWYWGVYRSAFHFPGYQFGRYFLNSFIVLAFAVLLCIAISATAGYGFAKYRFRLNNALFLMILSTLMIPFEAVIVPLFLVVKSLGMNNSYLGMIIPESLTAFGVFMMRQFFYQVPTDYIESARIDGANEYRIFWNISLPMARTAVLALVIFHGQWVWNLLIWPLIVVSTPELRTVPQAISQFTGVYFSPYPEQLAVSVAACLPLVILFMFLSKYFVQGIQTTGIKG